MDFTTIETCKDQFPEGKFGRAEGGIVVTAFPLATEAGVKMLEQGGNAVDAACAAAFALGVCEPQSSGLGGQTMAIAHIDGRTLAIDGSSRVPSLAHINKFDNAESIFGYRAATVPSTPATLGYLHLRYGRLKWPAILEPAIRIAREGYHISALQHQLQTQYLDEFLSAGSQSGARYFLKEGKIPHNAGDIFVQPELCHVLETLADQGPRAFYLGEIARRLSEDMAAHEGFLSSDDLALIPWPVERPPVWGNYRGISVAALPPPAAGRALVLVLLMLNSLQSQVVAEATPQSCHFLAETFRKALLQRHQRPISPNHYLQNDDDVMCNPDFARQLMASIHVRIAPGLPLEDIPVHGTDTTHLSVMDAEGNAIGISQSIESLYGSKVAAEGLGFLYNNYLKSLEIKDPGNPYFLRPNAVPYSSMSPAILFHKQAPWLVVGSPGSDRIFSAISQFLIHLLDGNKSLAEAVAHPRLHCSIGGTLSIEAERFDVSILTYLNQLGYKLELCPSYSFYLGAIYAAMRCQTLSGFQGVAEVRREGFVAGPR
jgi:gamma-glutamyltranspeptidase/glutathione hydrolase